MSHDDVARRVEKTISNYMTVLGQSFDKGFSPSTKLMRDAGLSSDDGVMLVLDLCQEFEIELPDDFNATVHDDGRRDRTFGELVNCIDACVNSQEHVQ